MVTKNARISGINLARLARDGEGVLLGLRRNDGGTTRVEVGSDFIPALIRTLLAGHGQIAQQRAMKHPEEVSPGRLRTIAPESPSVIQGICSPDRDLNQVVVSLYLTPQTPILVVVSPEVARSLAASLIAASEELQAMN